MFDGSFKQKPKNETIADAIRREIRFPETIIRPIRIILTIAHLDHDPENWDVSDDRLAALCQKCHLTHDAPMKAEKRKAKTDENKSIGLFKIV
jgi:hypothetical protein